MSHKRTLALFLTIGILLLGMNQATGQGSAAPIPQDVVGTGASAPLSTGFTYQGQLILNGAPVNGDCDFRFSLWDAASGGAQVGATLTQEEVTLTGGLFTSRLDFGGIHDGSARWLEVAARCPAGSGDYAALDPRQELTAAPAALALKLPYTAQANIGGPLVAFHNTDDGEAALFQSDQGYALWVESALLDGLHIASAGTSGVAVTAAGTGLSVGMATVDGVNIGNAGNSGLRVNWAGNHAVHVGTALVDGVHVDSAGSDGFYVGSAGGDGLSIASAADEGVQVQSAGGDGMYVGTATGRGLAVYNAGTDGVYVGAAAEKGVYLHEIGTPSGVYTTTSRNGFEVGGAQGDGLRVGRADLNGVAVHSAGMYGVNVGWADLGGVFVELTNYDGLYVDTAGRDGVAVYQAWDDGIHVQRAGNPSSVATNVLSNGVEVAGAQGHGVYVGRADLSGVKVESASYGLEVRDADLYGVYVTSAGSAGVSVGWAAESGFRVGSAGSDGLVVDLAGTPNTSLFSTQANGLEVAGAQGNGVFVGRADNTGVYVVSSGWNGIVVDAAGGDGVRAGSAVYNAFYGNTTNANGEWGLYTPDKIYAQNVTLQTLTLIAQVSGPDALAPGDVVAADGVGSSLPDASTPLPLVRLAGPEASGVMGVVEGRLAFTPAPQPEGVDAEERLELRSTKGPAQAGDYVALTVLGVARVKVDASRAAIQPGTRLASGAGGRARPLKTVIVDGVTLAESAPVLGVALAAPDADGLVWVLVNPQ